MQTFGDVDATLLVLFEGSDNAPIYFFSVILIWIYNRMSAIPFFKIFVIIQLKSRSCSGCP